MKLLTSLIFLFLLVLIVTPTLAERTVTVWGRSNCMEWMHERKSAEDISVIANIRWVEGYLSALNKVVPGGDRLGNIDAAVFEDWIDEFCARNPRMDLGDAADDLFLRLSSNGTGRHRH
jgi:hypothetical protein